ncbi:S9 family peptidase [Flavobacterium hydatis]|nr:prolyl oligopeptidase family serine peptidase [Flavobacterium hydatis]
MATTSWGQEIPKRALSKTDYHLWNKLLTRKLSNNGVWVSYLLMYESKKDTLFVKTTKGNITYNFPSAKDGVFNGESEFACIANDTLTVTNLKNGTLTKIANVHDFFFSDNNSFLLLLLKQSNGKQLLVVQDLKGKKKLEIPNVNQWHLEPNRNGLLYCTESTKGNEIGYLTFGKEVKSHSILADSKGKFQNLNWCGTTIAFVENIGEAPQLFSYNIVSGKLHCFDSRKQHNFPEDMKVSNETYQSLTISDDGDRIFFWMKEDIRHYPNIDPKAVQVWNTTDKLLFDHRKYVGQYTLMDKMAVWLVKSNRFVQITDRQIPKGFLSGDYKNAFIYDPIAYEPQSNFDGPFDLYVVNLQTGKRKRILEKYSGDNLTIPSPDGKYLAYPKEGNWWIYDINTDTHANITASIPLSFFRQDQDKPIEAAPYGNAGWTVQDNYIVLYDQYDLWQISVDGKIKKRLTRGREIERTYRIKHLKPAPIYQEHEIETKGISLQLEKGLLLDAVDKNSGASGFFKWTFKTGEKKMVWESKKINQITKALDRDSYIYVEQSYEVAPTLMSYEKSSEKVFQTNGQQKYFYWGKTEAVHFNVGGKKLSGILYFPAEYQQGIKYPMVVHIYERQFQYFNNYVNPTSYTGDGFNITNLTTQGYFVFLPDMVFEKGNVGQSATQCVLSAVDAVIARGFVDQKKIGLIGHSFGGYATDLIITQTDRFAAAVSGAAWTDLVSSYLYVGSTFSRPDFYRAEYDQLRIGKSLFEDTDSYLNNSPVLKAANVKTPLLGWTGEQDRHIHYLQSMEFYLALRRLNKSHILLVYPEEGHSLSKQENQKDLNERIKQWFDHYLKNDKPKDWMKNGYQ